MAEKEGTARTTRAAGSSLIHRLSESNDEVAGRAEGQGNRECLTDEPTSVLDVDIVIDAFFALVRSEVHGRSIVHQHVCVLPLFLDSALLDS